MAGGLFFQIGRFFSEDSLADPPLDDLRTVPPVKRAEIQDRAAE
jgi:hypothetical protein